jgi:Fe2+ or Zn2+ uptake regulation protein
VKNETVYQIGLGNLDAGPEAMLESLARNGYSNTRARRAVIEAIYEVEGQASPTAILARGQTHHPRLGRVTVYRTLELLQKLGLIRQLHSEDGCHAYAPAQHEHGHHVICLRCRRAVEFEGCDIGAVVAAVEEQTGFRVRSHWLEMFGLCPDCQTGFHIN